MTYYRARGNEIVNDEGHQVAVVLPTSCTKKAAREMAAYCAQQMNHIERDKARRAAASMSPDLAAGGREGVR